MAGYKEKDKSLQEYFKRASYLVHCSLVEQKHRLSPQQFWPIEEEDEEERESNLLRRFREAKEKAKKDEGLAGG